MFSLLTSSVSKQWPGDAWITSMPRFWYPLPSNTHPPWLQPQKHLLSLTWPSNQNVVTNIIILNCWKCLWWTNWVGLVGGVCSCQNGVYIFCFDCWCFLFACYCFYMYLCCVFWPVYRCICVVLLGLFAPLLPICCSFGQLAETHTKFLVWDLTTKVWKKRGQDKLEQLHLACRTQFVDL